MNNDLSQTAIAFSPCGRTQQPRSYVNVRHLWPCVYILPYFGPEMYANIYFPY